MKPDDLKARREALNLTVAQLAHRWHMLPSTLYRWERGDVAIPGTVDDALRWIAHERITVLTRMQEDHPT